MLRLRRPNRDKNRNKVDDRLDSVVNVSAIALPLTTLPQLDMIYRQQLVEGVSALTWFLYALLTIPLWLYSLIRRDTPMLILNSLWLVIDLAVAFGVIWIRSLSG